MGVQYVKSCFTSNKAALYSTDHGLYLPLRIRNDVALHNFSTRHTLNFCKSQTMHQLTMQLVSNTCQQIPWLPDSMEPSIASETNLTPPDLGGSQLIVGS